MDIYEHYIYPYYYIIYYYCISYGPLQYALHVQHGYIPVKFDLHFLQAKSKYFHSLILVLCTF